MTNTDAHVPAGWYPDPSGAQQLRWWDGTQWTAHFAPLAGAAQAQQQQPVQPQPVYAQQPAYTQQPGYAQQPAYGQTYAPVRPRLADGARIYNVYIWLVVALPFVSLVLLPFYQPHFDVVATEHGYTSYGNPFGMFGPMYFAIVGIGFLAYALSVVFSWLDYRELERIGVVRPFHWAWTFLSALVYVIGRSVIVRRVAPGRGLAPIWVTIGLYVLSLIVTIAWTVSFVSTMVHDLPMRNLGA
ncbi:DUF2510 domain-containing protein [Leifsonia sp. NCR5]|uniref:DUF2510 domain-containing protein n=1 Tax=Leifsonia sp. NCR5 TaxID=1978342 RepID=UPI000A18AD28|nr:DUF2510 domain-containing protein [Leifsonia sp. NCR5]